MKPIVIANWKMQLDYHESLKLAEELKDLLSDNLLAGREAAVCPSFTSLLLISEALKDSNIKLGSQDAFWADKGAFTGCESPQLLYDLGCRYAIIGHSERRQYLGETDAMVNRKIKSALASGLIPIVCVGETREEKAGGRTDAAIIRQIQKAFEQVDLIPTEQAVIAYEPVWVIGSGRAVDPQEAEHAFAVIHQTLIDILPPSIAENNIRLVYGGAVDAGSAEGFAGIKRFGGLLVGGASLNAQSFADIVSRI